MSGRRKRNLERAAKKQVATVDPLRALTERVEKLEKQLNNPTSAPIGLSTPMVTYGSSRTAGFKGAGYEWPIRLDPLL